MSSPSARRSVYAVPKMDCPSEERLIRMSLEGVEGVAALEFDLGARRLSVLHQGDPGPISARLEPLGLGARLVESAAVETPAEGAPGREAAEASTLRLALAINAAMFAVEIVAGWMAQSTGLIADSLDMLADAGVYGLALVATARGARARLRAAHAAGWLQLALALGALADVVRRAALGSAPEAPAMMGVSLVALAANASVLLLLTRHRRGGVHMKASLIFSANDVLANLGVIAAGALVAATGSRVPDLLIGAAVALLVLTGAVRILRLR